MPQAIVASVTDRAEAYLPNWYALRTRANREKAVSRDLQRAGIPEFLPLYSVRSVWSDRTKTIQKPLFPGYVFARVAARHLDSVIRIRGIVQILGSSLHPTPIADEDIAAVRRVIDSHMNLEPCDYQVGEIVTVESGAMAGQTGRIVRTKGAQRLVVLLDLKLMSRAVSVELDADTVTRGTTPDTNRDTNPKAA